MHISIMENTSDQLQGQERLRILAEQNDLSDILFTILTSAGYDTISAVAMLNDDLNSLETFYKNNSQLFSLKERERLYSRCNNCPENFIILPGHRLKLSSFIRICQSEDKTNTDTSTNNKRKRNDDLQIEEIIEKQSEILIIPNKKQKNNNKPVKKCEGIIIPDSASMEDILAATQDKLQKAFQRWQAGHPLEYIRMLNENVDYEVSVSANSNSEENACLIATVACTNCSSAVKMTTNRSGNFCISNATRHLVKCFSKQRKLNKQMSKNMNVSNMVIIKNASSDVNDEMNENSIEANGQVVPLLMHNYTVVPVTQAGEVVNAEFAEITCIPELPL